MSNIITTIPKGRPDHISLDFDLLRAEGIQHLENLATEVWTDFNAHDPGITILELLSYAITDLGYRTRMLPIADLLAGNDPTKKTWFTATEVLPNAPVTERDFRKLLIDVKGVKNAWLRKARPEEIVMMLYRMGWVFPEYMDADFKWDEAKLKELANSLNIPYPDNAGSLTIKKCIEKYFGQFELDPKLSTYDKAVKSLGGVDKLKRVELERYFRNVQQNAAFFEVELLVVLAEQYLENHTAGTGFPVFDAPYQAIADRYQIDYEGYTDFKEKGLVNVIKDFKFTIVDDKRLDLKTNLLEKEGIPFVEESIDNFMDSIQDDLAIERESDEVEIDDELIAILEKDYPESTKNKITKIRDYVKDQKKVISNAEKQKIVSYLDGDGTNEPNQTAMVRLWENFIEKYDYDEDGNVQWVQIEEFEFNRLNELLTSDTLNDEINFPKFKEIVTIDLPRAHFFENNFAPQLIEYYGVPGTQEITLSEQALSSFLLAAFNLNNAQATVTELLNFSGEIPRTNCAPLGDYLIEHLCEKGFYALTTNPDKANPKFRKHPVPLNGIYQIILDLDDDCNPANTKEVEAVVNRAMKRLHENRPLCEDFLPPQIVEQRPVHFCIHLDVSPDMDERAVMAEVIWRFQEYLTPTLHFRNFKEMHDLGIYCDEIYNGPLLVHGFLNDQEVDNAQLLEEYYHSDLVRIAMNTPGVLGVRELKVKATPEGKVPGSNGLKLTEGPVYSVYPEIVRGTLETPPPFLKRVIDLCESCFFISKGALPPIKLNDEVLHEQLEWIKMTHNCEFCADPGGHTPDTGIYRPDLSDYRSVQYDLPAVYTVGDNQVLDNASPLRKAQARQLQAYLAFFDQILAAYLAQLGQVNRLLSVDQDPKTATRILLPLYEVPGVRELIEYQAAFTAKPDDWILTLADIPETERNAVRTALGTLVTTATNFDGFYSFRQQLSNLLDATQFELAAPIFSNYFWEKYATDETNNFQTHLLAAAETPAHRQQHRNRLLDHLLARFGESFGSYVHALLLPDAEPEDNPWRQDFDEYLEDKARFLREIAGLSYGRGLGYNYRKMLPITHQPDVWLTDNVAGVKKRVSRLAGIDDYNQKSLIAEPPYRLDIVPSQNNQGTAQYRIVLKKRPEAVNAGENPVQAGPLMYSIRYASKKKVQDKVTELYKNIWKTSLFKTEVSANDSDKWVAKYSLPDNELMSDAIGEEEAKGLLLLIQGLVQPGKGEVEGFHIIEHILLRPNDPKDHLLQIPLGCDPKETPYDPYSFWITVILPNWTSRFKHADFRYFFEQTFRAETPSHIGIRFCWVDLQTMYLFEDAFRKWLIEKAKCTPSECHVTDAANVLIDLLNTMPCTCHCVHDLPEDLCDECGKPNAHR